MYLLGMCICVCLRGMWVWDTKLEFGSEMSCHTEVCIVTSYGNHKLHCLLLG